MKDSIQQTEVSTRPLLTHSKKEECRKILEELFVLHEETDPSLGEGSQKDKCKKAEIALMKIGKLSTILTEWAENQLFGNYYKAVNLQEDKLDLKEKQSSLHENETNWYRKKIPDSVWNHMGYLSCSRAALAKILELTTYSDGIMSWRLSLAESLHALNDGQTNKILRPINTKQQGHAYEIKNLKHAAIVHVYALIGEGWKKTAAIQEVADNCGVNFEAIRAWEKSNIKIGDKYREFYLNASHASQVILEVKKEANANNDKITENEILEHAIISYRYWKETDENNKKIIEASFLGIENIYPEDMSVAITNFIDIKKKYPLESLKERFSKAHFRTNKKV